MKRTLISLSLIISPLLSFAQQHSRCDSALIVTKESTGPVYADGFPDPNLALKDNTGAYFEKPHSVFWFKFTCPIDTVLTFDIVPTEPNDDIDFLLFKDSAGNFANLVKAHKIRPVRANIAHCDKSLAGKTGISADATNNYEPVGKHPAFSASINVKKGERFYLSVDNYTHANGSFTLLLHLRWPAKPLPPPPPKPPVKVSSLVHVNLIVIDSIGKPVKAKLKIDGAIAHKTIDTTVLSKYSLKLQWKQRIKIISIAPGHLLDQNDLYVREGDTLLNDTIQLSPIRKKQKIVLQDIMFVSDESTFISSSMEALSELLEFMQENPSVHILIKGFVNDPKQLNSSKFDQNLSEARAQAVLRYLKDHGIDEGRMDWKGFGCKDMLYPDPQTFEEQQANRRVEIEVK